MILRPGLRYHPRGHPVLSRRDLDKYADEFTLKYFPERRITPSFQNSGGLLKLLKDEDDVACIFSDLGTYNGGKILGQIQPKRKVVSLDESLLDNRQISFPFVAAHEFAHWVLHRDCDLIKIRASDSFPSDDEQTETRPAPKNTRPSMDWIEWQANYLAASILIPPIAAVNCIIDIHTNELPTNRQIRRIYKNLNQPAEAEHALSLVAQRFGVSKTVMRIRLKAIGLYEEQKPRVGIYGY